MLNYKLLKYEPRQPGPDTTPRSSGSMGMQTRSGKKKPKVPKQAPEALVGRIGAIFARRSDLGDDLDEGEQRKVTAGKDHAHFDRVRVDEGTFTPQGLKGSTTFQNSKRFREKNSPVEDRAVCLVTSRMSAALEAHAAATPLRKPVSFGPGRLGEQLWVESDTLDTSVVCVGDEFGVFRGGALAFTLRVASPRRPCSYVDSIHGGTYTRDGVRSFAARTGNAGIFCRVLGDGGAAAAGDELRLLKRPHPTWPLARLAKLVYSGKGLLSGKALPRSDWGGTAAELEEAAALPELAVLEWKEELNGMLGRKPIGQYAAAAPAPTRAAPDAAGGLGAVVALAIAGNAALLLLVAASVVLG